MRNYLNLSSIFFIDNKKIKLKKCKKMVEYKPIDDVELEKLISKILCKHFGLCPAEPETDKVPNKCIPVLKAGENYIQYDPQKNAYHVWAKDGTYFGVTKSKDQTCQNLKPYKDGNFYGLK